MKRYKASPELESWLLKVAGPHYVCHDVGAQLTTLDALQRFKALHGFNWRSAPIPVYPYADDSPFTPEADAAYQAYHDRCHALYGFQFCIDGEFRLASFHYNHAKRSGLCEEDCLALFYFVAARVAYHYYCGNGNDPPDRAEFLQACFDCGPEAAARGHYLEQYADLFCK